MSLELTIDYWGSTSLKSNWRGLLLQAIFTNHLPTGSACSRVILKTKNNFTSSDPQHFKTATFTWLLCNGGGKKHTHTNTRSLPKIHSKTFINSIREVLFLWMPLLTTLSYPQAPQRRWDDMLLLLRRSSPVHLRVPTLPLWQCRSTRPLARPGDLETDRNTRGKGMCRWFIEDWFSTCAI